MLLLKLWTLTFGTVKFEHEDIKISLNGIKMQKEDHQLIALVETIEMDMSMTQIGLRMREL
jgi:hypothetical protein